MNNDGVGSLCSLWGSGATPNCCNWSGGRSLAADAEGRSAADAEGRSAADAGDVGDTTADADSRAADADARDCSADEDARGCPADEDARGAADEDARGAADADARGCPAGEGCSPTSEVQDSVSAEASSRCVGASSSQPTTAARKILLATSSKPAGGLRYNALQFVQSLKWL